MPNLHRPVLLAAHEIGEEPSSFGYPAGVIDAAIDRKTADGSYRDGLVEATERLLGESGVVVYFIDIASPGEQPWEGAETFKRPDGLLAINDHNGGSESAFKIVVNRADEEEAIQHTLYAPPEEDGRPSNTVFHRAVPHMLSRRSDTALTDVPNPTKTNAVARAEYGRDPDFYVVGDREVPHQFAQTLEAAGFTFDDASYGPVFDDEHARLRGLESRAKTLDPLGRPAWPKDMFAEQIVRLRDLEQ